MCFSYSALKRTKRVQRVCQVLLYLFIFFINLYIGQMTCASVSTVLPQINWQGLGTQHAGKGATAMSRHSLCILLLSPMSQKQERVGVYKRASLKPSSRSSQAPSGYIALQDQAKHSRFLQHLFKAESFYDVWPNKIFVFFLKTKKCSRTWKHGQFVVKDIFRPEAQ